MPLESEPILDENNTEQEHFDDFLFNTFKKFDSVTFNQEKNSFIVLVLSVLLSIKFLEFKKGFFKDWFANAWAVSDVSKEEQFSNIYTILSNFIVTFIDPAFSPNDVSYYLASNEDNFTQLLSILEHFFKNISFESIDSNDSIIDTFYLNFLSYSKPKKDYNVLNVSKNAFKFLLEQSLQQDFSNLYNELQTLFTDYNSDQKEKFLTHLTTYKVLDPFTFTGMFLTHVFSNFIDFYHKILGLIKQQTGSNNTIEEICNSLFGKATPDINENELRNIILLRHIFGIVPEKDFVLLTKINIYLSINNSELIQNPIKCNFYFNILKGNVLLGYKQNLDLKMLENILKNPEQQMLAKELETAKIKYINFVLGKEQFSEIKTVKESITELIREIYLEQLTDLKIKSDLQEKLAIINPNIEFYLSQHTENGIFSLVIGLIPNKLRLTLTMTKVLIKNYYERPEDTINVVNLFTNKFLELTAQKGKTAIFITRNLLYHGEYNKLREDLLRTTTLRFVTDFGDYKYLRQSKGTALVISDKKVTTENIFKGLSLLALEQDQKEQYVNSFSQENTNNEKVIYREINQNEFLEMKGFRFFIKKPSKWFTKFSAVPNTLHEYIESIEPGLKVGENKILYIPDQKVKELQLEPVMLKNALKGKNFHRFSIPENNNLLVIPPETSEEQMQAEVPNTYKYLQENKTLLETRPQVKKNLIKWFQIVDAEKVTENYIKPPKIFLREKANEPIAIFDTKGTLQISSALAMRFNKQIKFRDYFKILAWINSLVVKAGYQDLTQDTKADAIFSKESIHDVTIPLTLLKDDVIASNVQQIVQTCLANKFSFNPHLLLLEYPEGQFHPEIYNFLFEKVYDVIIKKMKNLLDKTIKLSDIAIIEVNQASKKKKIEVDYLYPIFQDYAKSILVLKDGDLEITFKMKPKQAYTLPFLQLFLAYQPKDMVINYLKTFTKPEPVETIIAGWPVPELQMKHVMETYNFVRFQRQNYINFFNRTKTMLIKVETQIATHYGFTPEEITELLADKELIQS